MESALFSRFEENFKPAWRFWKLWRSKMRFGRDVLRMTSKVRFVQFSWRAHCFPVSKRIWGHFHEFQNFDAQNAIWPKRAPQDLKRAFCRIFIKSPLFSRLEENLRPTWRFWELLLLKMRFGQKRAPQDLKRAFCTIFIESALFFRFEENFKPAWRFWKLWRSKMRFGQNVLRKT